MSVSVGRAETSFDLVLVLGIVGTVVYLIYKLGGNSIPAIPDPFKGATQVPAALSDITNDLFSSTFWCGVSTFFCPSPSVPEPDTGPVIDQNSPTGGGGGF